MILELDCGNSFIKWRVLEVDGAPASSEGVVSSDAALNDGLIALPGLLLTRCRLVSVRAQEETEQLVEALVSAFGVSVSCAVSAREMAGVRNGYDDFERLGLDRWLAMLGGYKLASGACLVLDFGTAATADLLLPTASTWGASSARDCRSCAISCVRIPGRYATTMRRLSERWSASCLVIQPSKLSSEAVL